MPKTKKAIRTKKATETSTTSGMPLAQVAASTSPFSSAMKPMTWLMTLRRVIIIKSPSRMIARAKARSSRVSPPCICTTGKTTMTARMVSATPASMVRLTPTNVSMLR